jgi:hypothetical protein
MFTTLNTQIGSSLKAAANLHPHDYKLRLVITLSNKKCLVVLIQVESIPSVDSSHIHGISHVRPSYTDVAQLVHSVLPTFSVFYKIFGSWFPIDPHL